MNLMAIIFIRGYIKYLCDISCAGRDFLSPMGNIQPMFDVLGAHVIVGNYTIRDLYYKYCSDYYGSVKNYGKMFEINFFNEIKDWTNVTYFGAWFSCLTSKGTKKKSYLSMLKLVTNDIDLEKLGKLIMFSKSTGLVGAVVVSNENVVPPDDLLMAVFMEKHLNLTVAESIHSLNRMIRSCDCKGAWYDILKFARENGIVSNFLLECLLKLRIFWCIRVKELNDSIDDAAVAASIVKELAEKYYSSAFNIQEIIDGYV
jgi:hypothetical protein